MNGKKKELKENNRMNAINENKVFACAIKWKLNALVTILFEF